MAGASERGRSAAISAALRRPVVQWGWLFALVAGVLIAAFAVPKAQPKAQPIAGDDTQVLAADTTLGDAVRAGDKMAARRLLALQFNFVDADGKIHTRKDFLADLKGAVAAPASDVKVRCYGLLAVVTGYRKSAQDADVFFLEVWAKQKGVWRVLVTQHVAVAADTPTATVAAGAAAVPPAGVPPYECKNPCQTVPYRVRSPAEQDIVTAFQAMMKAVVANDAGEWEKHVAEEFVVYDSGRAPAGKSERITTIERQKERDAAVAVGEVQTMRLAVYGDGAVMVVTDGAPDGSLPPYRVARVWVRRNGQWLMTLAAHTDIK